MLDDRYADVEVAFGQFLRVTDGDKSAAALLTLAQAVSKVASIDFANAIECGLDNARTFSISIENDSSGPLEVKKV